MRGFLEIKIIWLGFATYLIFQESIFLSILIFIQLSFFIFICRPIQKVTIIGGISLILFGIILSFIDFVFGGFEIFQLINWCLVGLCYIILYEFIALYELSQFLKDYHIPKIIIIIINFGLRFLPIFFNTIHEVYIGYKSKTLAKSNKFKIAIKIAPSVIIILLNKFEQIWISYNIRFNDDKNFNIKIMTRDVFFIIIVLINISFLILIKKQLI